MSDFHPVRGKIYLFASLPAAPRVPVENVDRRLPLFQTAHSSLASRVEAAKGTPRMLQARSEPRARHESPVRVFGLDKDGKAINQVGMTADISQHGACLKGIYCWEAPGETVGVRCGTEKARFKVVWIGKPGSPQEGQVGLLCLEAGKFIWGLSLPAGEARTLGAAAGAIAIAPPHPTIAAGSSKQQNRRKDARFCASGGAKIQEMGSPAGQWTMLRDISLGGCYVETTSPLRAGVPVQTLVHIGSIQITARGQITVADRLVGMGVRFTEMTPLNRQRLESVLDHLMQSGAARA
jgi:PilZ domain